MRTATAGLPKPAIQPPSVDPTEPPESISGGSSFKREPDRSVESDLHHFTLQLSPYPVPSWHLVGTIFAVDPTAFAVERGIDRQSHAPIAHHRNSRRRHAARAVAVGGERAPLAVGGQGKRRSGGSGLPPSRE